MERDAKADLELCRGATAGPWSFRTSPTIEGGPTILEVIEPSGEWRVVANFESDDPEESSTQRRNFAHIAAAREALPYWIQQASDLHQEVVRLQEELDEVKKEFQDYRRDY